MKHYRQSTQEISYAYSAQTFSGRTLIKILENVTGRVSLIKRAQGYERELESGDNSSILCSEGTVCLLKF